MKLENGQYIDDVNKFRWLFAKNVSIRYGKEARVLVVEPSFSSYRKRKMR